MGTKAATAASATGTIQMTGITSEPLPEGNREIMRELYAVFFEYGTQLADLTRIRPATPRRRWVDTRRSRITLAEL